MSPLKWKKVVCGCSADRVRLTSGVDRRVHCGKARMASRRRPIGYEGSCRPRLRRLMRIGFSDRSRKPRRSRRPTLPTSRFTLESRGALECSGTKKRFPSPRLPRRSRCSARLVLTHGPLALFQSGGCCDGSLPLCLLADDLAPGPGDVLLGEVTGVPFYIDAEQFRRWGDPEFLLDVAGGAPEGFSLGLPNAHFVTLSPVCKAGAA